MINHEECRDKTDEELVKLALENPDHFLCLSKRYEKKLLYYIMRISKFTRDDAEDILQEVLIKTYYNLNGFDPSLRFSSWIYRITHNETVSAIRKKSVRPSVSFERVDLEKFEDALDLVKELDKTLDRQNINRALSKLEDKYREVLVLRYLDEKEYLEISDILKKPVSTVGNLILRGKKLFKDEYQKIISPVDNKEKQNGK